MKEKSAANVENEPEVLNNHAVEEEIARVIDELTATPEEKIIVEDTLKDVAEGKTVAESMGAPPDFLESIYEYAYRVYQGGRYDQAERLFRLLLQLDPNETKYIIGLAGALQMQKKLDLAIGAYTAWGLSDPLVPFPWFYCAHLYRKIDMPMGAFDSYRKAADLCFDLDVLQPLKAKALLNMESLIRDNPDLFKPDSLERLERELKEIKVAPSEEEWENEGPIQCP